MRSALTSRLQQNTRSCRPLDGGAVPEAATQWGRPRLPHRPAHQSGPADLHTHLRNRPALIDNSFDIYFADDEDSEFKLGGLSCKLLHLPGHTPDHVGFVIGKAVFTGDSILNVGLPNASGDLLQSALTWIFWQPDVGSARVNFPGGNVELLYSVSHRPRALHFHWACS